MRSLPKRVWLCVLIAIVNAACWAVLTPSYWVPDEPAHAGYVQYLAETGNLPRARGTDLAGPGGFSQEQSRVYGAIPFGPEGRPSWSKAADRAIKRELATGDLPRAASTQAQNATSNPPLYYALDAIGYRIAYSGDYFDRLLAMRLVSALFAGVTVLFVFLFLRQLLPRHPWTWTVGALAVAFQPLLGFMSGGVNNDGLVYAVSAAVLWSLARAFRIGLTWRTGAVIAAALSVGVLTKVTILGLLPGVLVALAVLVLRNRTRPVFGAAVLALVPPFLVYQVTGMLRQRLLEDAPATPSVATRGPVQGFDRVMSEASYLWQSVLPKLPFMGDRFDGYPPWDIYFQGFVGRFGWFQYGFAYTWYWVALVVFGALLVLAGRGLWLHREALARRRGELIAYGAVAAGLFLGVEHTAFGYRENTGLPFEQTRYLFPLLALYGALVAIACLGAGRRWGPAVGAFIVTLAFGHSLFSQLLTVGRFYL